MPEPEAIRYSDERVLPLEQVLLLYRANDWSAADHPEELAGALAGSQRVVSAWHGEQLVGLGNALSDGHLVVYYPHLLVHPDYQRRGIGRALMERLLHVFGHLHQQVLVAEPAAVEFYRRCGFEPTGERQALWIYGGGER